MYPKLAGATVLFLLVFGLYFPTSINGQISTTLQYAFMLGVTIGLLVLVWRRPFRRAIIMSIVVAWALAAATITSPFGGGHESYGFGVIGLYGLLLIALCINVRYLRPIPLLRPVWILANIVNLCAGIGIVLGDETISSFTIKYYSAFEKDMVSGMMSLRKPVLMFGSHSIAAFYFFAFFLLNIYTFLEGRRKLYLFLGCGNLVLAVCLQSVTGYIAGIGGLLFVAYTVIRNRRRWMVGAAIVSIMGVFFWIVPFQDMGDEFRRVLTSPGSGFVGRYSSEGLLRPSIDYLVASPWRPIGITNPEKFWNTDSGYIEFAMRGTVVMAVLIYVGLWRLIKNNVRNRDAGTMFFGALMAFEVGYPNLLYLRTLALLPVFVVFLANLGDDTRPVSARRWRVRADGRGPSGARVAAVRMSSHHQHAGGGPE